VVAQHGRRMSTQPALRAKVHHPQYARPCPTNCTPQELFENWYFCQEQKAVSVVGADQQAATASRPCTVCQHCGTVVDGLAHTCRNTLTGPRR
jgi:hypothetical protein